MNLKIRSLRARFESGSRAAVDEAKAPLVAIGIGKPQRKR